jgi:hypothetical protein
VRSSLTPDQIVPQIRRTEPSAIAGHICLDANKRVPQTNKKLRWRTGRSGRSKRQFAAL